MNWSIIFFIVIVLLLLRVFWLRVKAHSTQTDSFQNLPPEDQLAILKECLLNNPTETNLQNLSKFLQSANSTLSAEDYRPFMKTQNTLLGKKNAIQEDNELYAKETEWLDQITPIEFEKAEKAKASGDKQQYVEKSIEGIARLYSDDAILQRLEELKPDYPFAETLIADYKSLMETRDESGADDASLEKLKKLKAAWEDALLNIKAAKSEN